VGSRGGRVLAAVGLAAALAGCGSGSSAPTATPVTGPSVELLNMPTGTAILSVDEKTHRLSAKLDAYGLTPNSAHALHITNSKCVGKQGAPAFSFPDVSADGAGALSTEVTATEPAPKGIPSGMEIDLHLVSTADSGKGPDAGSTPIACTDIPTTTATRLALRLYPFPGEKPAATATFAYNSGSRTLTVHLTGFGLMPRSTHAADIDLGSCMKQGKQQHALKDAVADPQGRIDATTALTGVDQVPPKVSWYLLVHEGARSETGSAAAPAPLFRPILCADLTRV
jgi:hypothetical protein